MSICVLAGIMLISQQSMCLGLCQCFKCFFFSLFCTKNQCFWQSVVNFIRLHTTKNQSEKHTFTFLYNILWCGHCASSLLFIMQIFPSPIFREFRVVFTGRSNFTNFIINSVLYFIFFSFYDKHNRFFSPFFESVLFVVHLISLPLKMVK